MKTAIYPGSFDPIHNGHLDVIRRASMLCEQIIVAVAQNDAKAALFPPEERVDLISQLTDDLPNVRVLAFDGLLVNLAAQEQAQALIRGLRAVSDFEYELQMALANRQLAPDLETIFLTPSQEHIFLSSRIVKAVAAHRGDITGFVPKAVEQALEKKL